MALTVLGVLVINAFARRAAVPIRVGCGSTRGTRPSLKPAVRHVATLRAAWLKGVLNRRASWRIIRGGFGTIGRRGGSDFGRWLRIPAAMADDSAELFAAIVAAREYEHSVVGLRTVARTCFGVDQPVRPARRPSVLASKDYRFAKISGFTLRDFG